MSISKDVLVNMLFPHCDFKTLMILRGLDRWFYENVTNYIFNYKKYSEKYWNVSKDVYTHCSFSFIHKYMNKLGIISRLEIANQLINYRSGRINNEFLDEYIWLYDYNQLTTLLNQKLEERHLKTIMQACFLHCFSYYKTNDLDKINKTQYITPYLLLHFQEIWYYPTIHLQTHLHPHLLELRKTNDNCRKYTDWSKINNYDNNPYAIFILGCVAACGIIVGYYSLLFV
jgi:hypothetical protein